MPCDDWRGKLDAYADGELSLPEMNALADHLRSCAECSVQALQRVQLKRSIAMAGRRYEPSTEFRAKIASSVSGKRDHGTGWFWKILVVPALLTLIFVAGLNYYVRGARAERQRVYSELADLHVATLASSTPVDVVSTDRHTVKPWFLSLIHI